MKCKRDIVGYAVREVDGLRCWYKKRSRSGVFLDSSKERARVYETERGASSAANLLNILGYKYKDGTDYRFEVVPID